MTSNLDYSFLSLSKLIDHNRLDRNHFNNFYHVFVTGKTNTNVSGSFVCQLAKFVLKFEQQAVSIHELFFFRWIVRGNVFFKVCNTLNNLVFANNEVFLTDLFQKLCVFVVSKQELCVLVCRSIR